MKRDKAGEASDKPRAMSVDLPGVREAINEFCTAKPIYARAAVEKIVREAATVAAQQAVSDVAKLVAAAA